MTPSTADKKKAKTKVASLAKKLDAAGKMREKDIVTAVRGAIRRVWMKWPAKLHYLLSRQIPDDDPATRTKWLYRCEKCEGLFKAADVEIDHKKGENPCTTLEEIADYAVALLGVGAEDIQLLCKSCHLIKTYQERFGVSEFDAKVMIAAAPVLKKKANDVKAWLAEQGVEPASNAEKRKQQVLEYFRKEVG